jgi:hypothetical protein
VPGYAPISWDSNDPYTVLCGFRARLCRDLFTPAPGILELFRDFVRDFLIKNVRRVEVMPFEEWLASTSYNEQRKEQLREAYKSLRGGRPTRRQAQHIDSFVKTEFYLLWKYCRLINSRCDAFKCYSGPYFKAIEEVVYELPQFIKHTPVRERPALIDDLRQAGVRFYGTDYTAFESHFVPEVLDVCECELYRHCLANYPADAEFLCSTIMGTNRMRTRTGISLAIEGRRMSGDMCTSLGNGFTNLMLTAFIVAQKGGQFRGFVEGDDGIFATNVSLEASDYEKLGWSIKIEEVADPSEAPFCGMVFARSKEIIREPRKFMAGFGWTSSFTQAGHGIMQELLRAKSLSTCYETPQCPVVGALARLGLRSTRGVRPRFVDDGYHICPDEFDIPEFAPAPDTRQLFAHLYGISVAEQLLAEAAIQRGDLAELGRIIPPNDAIAAYAAAYVVAT